MKMLVIERQSYTKELKDYTKPSPVKITSVNQIWMIEHKTKLVYLKNIQGPKIVPGLAETVLCQGGLCKMGSAMLNLI